MKQQSFEAKHEKSWNQIETWLDNTSEESKRSFPEAFRHLCHQLALAKNRRYSPQLISRLNHLTMQSHHYFYQDNTRFNFHWLTFLVWGFPDALRRNYRYMITAWALFLIPALAMGLACYFNDEFIYTFASPEDVLNYESMYNPANSVLGRERSSDSDIAMFGFYIKNNIGVSFRTFAGGVFFGLGSVFFLIFNGIAIGSVAGHLTQLGFTSTFYPFVVGHGAFELTAIVFSGAAGLKLGYALINPKDLSRANALKVAGHDAILIIYGSILMLVIAAFLEAFWSSSSTLPIALKYSVGALFWLLVITYCFFSGKRYGSPSR